MSLTVMTCHVRINCCDIITFMISYYESHLWDSFLYPVETQGPVMVPGAVTPGVCIWGPSIPAFGIQLIAVCQFLDFTLQCA